MRFCLLTYLYPIEQTTTLNKNPDTRNAGTRGGDKGGDVVSADISIVQFGLLERRGRGRTAHSRRVGTPQLVG